MHPTCPNCTRENLSGSLSCAFCGSLLVSNPMATRTMERTAARFSGNFGTNEFGESTLLQITDRENEPLTVDIVGEMMLGCTSRSDSNYISLASLGALEKGVSRDHAIIWREGNALLIRDNGSTNGTAVNGNAVQSKNRIRIADGNTIRLGALELSFYWVVRANAD